MPRKLISLFLISCLPALAHGQMPGDDSLQKEINRLENKKVDTILTFSYDNLFPGPVLTDIENLGYVRPEDSRLIFYRRNHRLLCENLLLYTDTTYTGQKQAISNPIVLNENDTLFHWLRNKIGFIEHETILPYIYKTKRYDSSCYEMLYEYDEGVFNIGLFIGEVHLYKPITPYTLNHYESLQDPETENLNYFVNTHTQLYQLYRRLELYFEKLKDSFTYPVNSQTPR